MPELFLRPGGTTPMSKSDLMGIGHLANLTCETIVCPRCSKHNRIGPSRGLISQVKSRFSQTQCPIWLWPDLASADHEKSGRAGEYLCLALGVRADSSGGT